MAIRNPFQGQMKKKLTRALGVDTLEGGTEGSAVKRDEVPSASSASSVASSSQAEAMGTALDALSAMFCGYVGNDRKLLDEGFEDLVGIIEEWRDAIPKA